MAEGKSLGALKPSMLLGTLIVVLACAAGSAASASGAPRFVGDPSQQAAVARLQQAQVFVHVHASTEAVASRAGSHCWPEVWERYTLKTAGVTIAWAQVDLHGWCGNGHRITWQGGASFPKWKVGVYCWSDSDTNNSWLQFPTWRHAKHTRQIGVPTPLGCIGIRTLHAHLRYAANGYWDYRY
jgi:hypothetical protein